MQIMSNECISRHRRFHQKKSENEKNFERSIVTDAGFVHSLLSIFNGPSIIPYNVHSGKMAGDSLEGDIHALFQTDRIA